MSNTHQSEYYCSLCLEIWEENAFLSHFKKCDICDIHVCRASLKICANCEKMCCDKCIKSRDLCTDCTPTCNKCKRMIFYDQDQDNYELMWLCCDLCDSKTYYMCTSCRVVKCNVCLSTKTVCFKCQNTIDVCPHSEEERVENKRKQENEIMQRKLLAEQSDICRPS